MSEEINFDDVEFGEPIEEKEPSYRDGYIRGIYRARNIIDSKQKEIERLNNIIKSARDLFYEKCRISQNGVYTFNQVDYEELDNVLKGSDKE